MKNEFLSSALTFFRDKLSEFAGEYKITNDDFANIEASVITGSTAELSIKIVEIIAEREGKAFNEIRNEINDFFLKNFTNAGQTNCPGEFGGTHQFRQCQLLVIKIPFDARKNEAVN